MMVDQPANPPPPPVRIKELIRSESVHARLEQPNTSFAEMIGINFGGAQSPSMKEIDLGVDVSFGSIKLKIEDETYELSLRSAEVVLERDNAEVKAGSLYRRVLTDGALIDATRTVSTARSGRSFGLGGFASGGGDGAPSARVGARASLAADSARSSETIVETGYNVDLVRPSGQDKWTLGTPEGDPRQKTHDLRGDVISASEGDQLTPLCQLEAVDQRRPVAGRLRVKVRQTDFKLVPAPRQEAIIEDIAEQLERNAPKTARRQQQAEADLRNRVAALALLKNARRNFGSNGDIDIAYRAFCFVPEV